MLLPKLTYWIFLSFLITLLGSLPATAGIFGFDKANPYTRAETILDMEYLPENIRNYPADMRSNMQMLIDYAKANNPDFKFIVHEGQELLYHSKFEEASKKYNQLRQQKQNIPDASFLSREEETPLQPELKTPEYNYLNSIDAVVINNLFCGKGKEENITFNNNLGLITIDYCPSTEDADNAIIKSVLEKKVLYLIEDLGLAFNNISSQPMINDNAKTIQEVSDAKNILILTDDNLFSSKDDFVKELSNTNYDIIIINPLFAYKYRFSADDISLLKFKKNGARRLLIAHMNISETTPKDYFWNKYWKIGSPNWLARKSFVDENGIITKYWHDDWKKIISQHFKDIILTGFDGVFFTGLQNHFYFEKQTPLE